MRPACRRDLWHRADAQAGAPLLHFELQEAIERASLSDLARVLGIIAETGAADLWRFFHERRRQLRASVADITVLAQESGSRVERMALAG